jgi:hypothetical protein
VVFVNRGNRRAGTQFDAVVIALFATKLSTITIAPPPLTVRRPDRRRFLARRRSPHGVGKLCQRC